MEGRKWDAVHRAETDVAPLIEFGEDVGIHSLLLLLLGHTSPSVLEHIAVLVRDAGPADLVAVL